jgi:circadian clock protein KaiC
MARVKTGIQGLDKALGGGIPEGNLVLLSGGAGTGKSTLAMQYIVNGARMFGESGLFISTEQSEEELSKAASQFGWDLVDLQNKNLIKIVYFKVLGEDHFIRRIGEIVKDFQPKRVVIDSMTTLSDSLLMAELQKDISVSMVKIAESISPVPRTEQIMTKIILYNLLNKLRGFDSTIIMTSELHEGSERFSADGVSEFISDGVVLLGLQALGDMFTRTLQVRKMRYSKMDGSIKTYELTENGVAFE